MHETEGTTDHALPTEPATVMPAEPAPPQRWLRILRNPLVRIVLFVLMVYLFYRLARLLGVQRPKFDQADQLPHATLWAWAFIGSVPVILAYWLLVRVIEGRRVDELAARKLVPHTLIGLAIGAGLMIAVAGLMALFGVYRVEGMNEGVDLVPSLVLAAILPGITEEIMFRGVMFRVVEDGLGTWIAILISGAFFGLIHAGNPNATAWSSIAIALEAGVLLGLLYAWTRSLYVVIGLHAAWNFMQGAVLDMSVSGIEQKGLIDATTSGPEILSGGTFGAEASILTVLLMLGLSIVAARRTIALGNLRRPFWTRKKLRPSPSDLPAHTAS